VALCWRIVNRLSSATVLWDESVAQDRHQVSRFVEKTESGLAGQGLDTPSDRFQAGGGHRAARRSRSVAPPLSLARRSQELPCCWNSTRPGGFFETAVRLHILEQDLTLRLIQKIIRTSRSSAEQLRPEASSQLIKTVNNTPCVG
jgi:hypothetical protein